MFKYLGFALTVLMLLPGLAGISEAYVVESIRLRSGSQESRLILQADDTLRFRVDLAGPQSVELQLPGAHLATDIPSVDNDRLISEIKSELKPDAIVIHIKTRTPGVTVLPSYQAISRRLVLEFGGPPDFEERVAQGAVQDQAGSTGPAQKAAPVSPPTADNALTKAGGSSQPAAVPAAQPPAAKPQADEPAEAAPVAPVPEAPALSTPEPPTAEPTPRPAPAAPKAGASKMRVAIQTVPQDLQAESRPAAAKPAPAPLPPKPVVMSVPPPPPPEPARMAAKPPPRPAAPKPVVMAVPPPPRPEPALVAAKPEPVPTPPKPVRMAVPPPPKPEPSPARPRAAAPPAPEAEPTQVALQSQPMAPEQEAQGDAQARSGQAGQEDLAESEPIGPDQAAAPPRQSPPVRDPVPLVNGVRRGTHEDYTRIVLDGERPLTVHLAPDERSITLSLERGRLADDAVLPDADGRISGISVLQENPLRLVIGLRGYLGGHKLFTLEQGKKVVLDLNTTSQPPEKPAPAEPLRMAKAPEVPEPRPEPLPNQVAADQPAEPQTAEPVAAAPEPAPQPPAAPAPQANPAQPVRAAVTQTVRAPAPAPASRPEAVVKAQPGPDLAAARNNAPEPATSAPKRSGRIALPVPPPPPPEPLKPAVRKTEPPVQRAEPAVQTTKPVSRCIKLNLRRRQPSRWSCPPPNRQRRPPNRLRAPWWPAGQWVNPPRPRTFPRPPCAPSRSRKRPRPRAGQCPGRPPPI